jgi:hypothetical protein
MLIITLNRLIFMVSLQWGQDCLEVLYGVEFTLNSKTFLTGDYACVAKVLL